MNSEQARVYIKQFIEIYGKRYDRVYFADGEVVYFEKMTDEQAIKLAKYWNDDGGVTWPGQ